MKLYLERLSAVVFKSPVPVKIRLEVPLRATGFYACLNRYRLLLEALDAELKSTPQLSMSHFRWLETLTQSLPYADCTLAVDCLKTGVTLLASPRRLGLEIRIPLSAAHYLPYVGPSHKCHRLHGHDFEILLRLSDEQGDLSSLLKVAEDFRESRLQCLLNSLLNEIEGLENPTSENLALYLMRLAKEAGLAPESIQVHETSNSFCTVFHEKEHLQIGRKFDFESVFQQDTAYQGHSFMMNPVQELKIDSALGWTMDYSDIKRRMKPVIEEMDHRFFSGFSPPIEDPLELLHRFYPRIQSALPALCEVRLGALDWEIAV